MNARRKDMSSGEVVFFASIFLSSADFKDNGVLESTPIIIMPKTAGTLDAI